MYSIGEIMCTNIISRKGLLFIAITYYIDVSLLVTQNNLFLTNKRLGSLKY